MLYAGTRQKGSANIKQLTYLLVLVISFELCQYILCGIRCVSSLGKIFHYLKAVSRSAYLQERCCYVLGIFRFENIKCVLYLGNYRKREVLMKIGCAICWYKTER